MKLSKRLAVLMHANVGIALEEKRLPYEYVIALATMAGRIYASPGGLISCSMTQPALLDSHFVPEQVHLRIHKSMSTVTENKHKMT